jgi:GntR family carbon starvation induced transcriptional regulator
MNADRNAGLLLADQSAGPVTRTDWAEELLRAEILTGALRPGSRLKMADLIERYPGLSPTPLREALSRLAGSGLVDLLPNRGVRVAAGTIEELLDVHENRLLLETIAFERTLAASDDEWRAELREALDALARISAMAAGASGLTSHELIAWEKAHRAFHFVLLSRSGSPWLLRLVGLLYDQSVRYRYLTIRAQPDFERITAEHEELYTVATTAEPEEAIEVLRRHLQLTVDSASANNLLKAAEVDEPEP